MRSQQGTALQTLAILKTGSLQARPGEGSGMRLSELGARCPDRSPVPAECLKQQPGCLRSKGETRPNAADRREGGEDSAQGRNRSAALSVGAQTQWPPNTSPDGAPHRTLPGARPLLSDRPGLADTTARNRGAQLLATVQSRAPNRKGRSRSGSSRSAEKLLVFGVTPRGGGSEQEEAPTQTLSCRGQPAHGPKAP